MSRTTDQIRANTDAAIAEHTRLLQASQTTGCALPLIVAALVLCAALLACGGGEADVMSGGSCPAGTTYGIDESKGREICWK